MKIKAYSILITFLLASILIAIPTPAMASAPEQLVIEADMWITGENTAAGTFVINGLFIDEGSVTEEFFIAANTSHGEKTLVSAAGTITINYQVKLTWTLTSGIAVGRFVIVSGTGAYEKLHGVGDSYAELDLLTGHLTANYTGQAHFD